MRLTKSLAFVSREKNTLSLPVAANFLLQQEDRIASAFPVSGVAVHWPFFVPFPLAFPAAICQDNCRFCGVLRACNFPTRLYDREP